MTSQQFPLTQIYVEKDRQRRDLGDLTSLANSINTIGQIQPIVVQMTDDGLRLIAGERRFRAHQLLKKETIEAVLFEDLTEDLQVLIELEENIKRKQLTWQEEVRAVTRYVGLEKKPLELCATDLGFHSTSLSKMMIVAKALEVNKRLETAPSWSAAYLQIMSEQDKFMSSMLEDIKSGSEGTAEDDIDPFSDFPLVAAAPKAPVAGATTLSGITPAPSPIAPIRALEAPFRAEKQSFLEWAPAYTGKRFNLIHCDFPYGLNMDTANLQNSASRWDIEEDGRYADSPELFDSLVSCFFKCQSNFVADSAHCIFWTAHKNYGRIASRFQYFGWSVCEVPLIWHKSDNAGIAPDTQRWPRRTYEIAVFASFGDRKIAKVKAASYSGPTTKEHHLSEKPLAMLDHFLEMVVDSYTEILDPTCGSGTALEVAKQRGARSGLGLDTVADYVAITNKRLTK